MTDRKWYQVSYISEDGAEYASPRTVAADSAAAAIVAATLDPLPPAIRDGKVECSARRVAVLDLDAFGEGSHEIGGSFELCHRDGEFVPFPRLSHSDYPLVVEIGEEDVLGAPLSYRRLTHCGREWSGSAWRQL